MIKIFSFSSSDSNNSVKISVLTPEVILLLLLDDAHLRGEVGSCPVQLPLAVSGWVFKEELCEETENTETEPMITDSTGAEVKVKQEPLEGSQTKKAETMFRPPPLPEPGLLLDLLEVWNYCKEVELLFMQLPDSLPGQPPTIDVRPLKTEVQSSDGQTMLQTTENQEDSQDENSCFLKDLEEGLVGKMLVRKSGKVQLIMGNVTLDMALGTPCTFLQELVSVNTDGRRGDMSVLGHIKHKLVCSPDFQALLENRA
ncbi:DNA-directed RNA polymerase III subunit RPC4-like [Triplophysa dalaica]|uniref:DNA-directed RNA polymerase III subunit RPC4-like n=1 Tax=Triplophysa dalaica TaxID=1582913 RepID=UPI0024DFC98F|nr:DNA-directed RNA polymerase III subunit RPC4-like [Triplophysa dalaica]